MARKKRGGGDGGGEGTWMNTYADMVTLLLTFFVVLFSMSNVEQEKWEALLQSFQGKKIDDTLVIVNDQQDGSGPAENTADNSWTAGEEGLTSLPDNTDELYTYLKKYVEQNNLESTVSINKDDGVVYIRFTDNMLFMPDKYDLTEQAIEPLTYLGNGLKNMESNIKLILASGHTANIGYASGVNDWRLSSERAASVAIFLQETMGIEKSLFKTIGNGDSYPIADNDSIAGRQKNRRVELTIVGNDYVSGNPQAFEQVFGLYDASQYPADGGGLDIIDSTNPDAGQVVEPQTSPDDGVPATDPATP